MKKKNGVALEITDNGFGISDKEKKYIFDRFYRVGSEERRTTKGTGLGLYIVAQLVKAHGGNIEVSDGIERGTVFKLWLPSGMNE